MTKNLLRSNLGAIATENKLNLYPSAKKESRLPTLTIEDVRFISNWLSQQSSKSRVIIVHQSQNLTIPAQHAILKILEEPGENNYIILTADSETSLLPTIRSRCKIVREKEEERGKREEGENKILTKLIETAEQSPEERIVNLYSMLSEFTGKKYSPYQQVSITRPDALKFMENIIDNLHFSLIHKSLFINHKSLTICLSAACLSHRRLKNNLNVQLALQQFILDISTI